MMYKKSPFKLYHIHDFLSAPTLRGFFFNFLLKFVLAFFLFLEISCIYNQRFNQQGEGFYGNTLRVVVYDFIIPEDGDVVSYENNQVKEKVYSRATLLMASYISLKISKEKISPETDRLLNALITKTLHSYKILSITEEENNYHYIIAEFDLSELNDALLKFQ